MKAKIFILALLCLCLNLNTFAQNGNGNKCKIYGTVKDSESGNPIEFATAIILKNTDNTIVASSVTNDKGLFSFNEIPEGKYLIKFTFMGYLDTEKTLTVSPGEKEINVGSDIILYPDADLLKAAVVTAKRPLVERRIDKLIMNVEGAVATEGNTALDMLKKAPGVTVDHEGNIKLLNSGVLVQIDGRNTYLSSADLATLLGGMDASEISKIEIISSPSSKQDASGGSGILNIRTKKSILSGLTGSVNTGVTAAKYWGYNGGISLNYRNAWVAAYGSYNYRYNKMFNDIEETRYYTDTTQFTASNSKFDNRRGNYRFGLDFFLNPKNTLGFLVSGNHGKSESTTDAPTTIFHSLTNKPIISSLSNNTRDDNNNGITFNTNYRKLFNNDGQVLTADFDYARFKTTQNEDRSIHEIYHIIGYDTTSLIHNHSPREVQVFSGKADYEQILGKTAQLEFGGKISHSKTDSKLNWLNFYNDNWVNNSKRSNEFEYTERVIAAYASIAKQFNEKWSAKVGLRWENTWSKGYSPTTGQEKKRTYDDLFPTVFVQYKPWEKHDFSLTYNRRIQRPDYDDLNPFRSYIGTYTYVAGNPDLKPQYTDNVSLSHSLNNKLITSLSYIRQSDMIIQSPEQSEAIGESGVIQDNFGYTEMAIMNVSLPNLPVSKWYIISANAWAGWTHSHSKQNEITYDQYSWMGQGYLSNNFMYKSWVAEASAHVTSPTSWGYFKTKAHVWMSIGFKKSFFDNKLNLSLNIDDPFEWNKNSMDVKYDKFNYHYETRWMSRRVRFGAVWRFGSAKATPVRERKGGNQDELSRIKSE